MSRFFTNRTSICNLISVILLIVLLVFQFTPFWSYGENGDLTASIQGYIWFPSDHSALEKYFEAETSADHTINAVLAMPILLLLVGAVGIVVGLLKADQVWVGTFPTVCGAVGLWGYLTKPVFQLGGNWHLQLILCLALLAMGIVTLLGGYHDSKLLKADE